MYLLKNLYPENIDSNKMKSILDNSISLGAISFYAFIIHNLDVKPNGDFKKPHYHLIIEWCLTKSHSIRNDIIKFYLDSLYLGNEIQAQCEAIRSVHKQMRYLTHKDNLEKAQYLDSDVISSDFDYYLSLVERSINKSDTDLIIEKYLFFIEECSSKGIYPDRMTILTWWRINGKLNYYISHIKSLNDLTIQIYNFNLKKDKKNN